MTLAASIKLALRWPLFLISMALLYWSVVVGSLGGYIKFLDLKSEQRGDLFAWSVAIKRSFGIRVLRVGKRDVYRGKCMYLMNHRSWGDFCVDQYLTQGRAAFLARGMMAVVFPLFMIALRAMRAVLVFNRGQIPDKEKFNKWIDKELANTPQTGLAVYPEGHRSVLTDSLPLKRGMLHYAYSRKMTVQCIICANKEAVLSEKYQVARWGQTVWAGYSDPINAADFDSFEAFMTTVQSTWDALWKEVYGADPAGLPDLEMDDPVLDTPARLRYAVSASVVLVDVVFFLVLWFGARFAIWATSPLGPLRGYLLFAAVLTVVASFVVYSEPFNSVAYNARKHQRTAAADPNRVRATGASISDKPAGVAPPTDLVAHSVKDVTGDSLLVDGELDSKKDA